MLLSGAIERVVFHNPDSGWCVLKVKVKGRRRLTTVVGHSPTVAPGETIEAEGEWTEHAEHGERLMATTLRTTLPRDAGAAEKYLSSGMVSGIGPELARRLVERYGANVFDIIENSPELLRAVEGIGPSRAEKIREAWREQKALRGLMSFLATHGLSATKAPRIWRTLGNDALALIEKNPYRLAREVPGVGFKSADLIAKHTGIALDSEERFASALHDRLQRAITQGHCAYPADTLLSEAGREVGFPPDRLQEALDNEIEAGRFTEEKLGDDEEVCIFPAYLAKSEERLADHLLTLSRGQPPWGTAVFLEAPPQAARLPARRAASPVPLKSESRLSERQRDALKRILSSKVSILTGGPGTGKTTLIRSAYFELAARGWKVVCCAPTGRAAQRLSEAAGVEAQTIHRLLGWDATEHGFRHRPGQPLRADLLIVDEASMVGLELMDALVQALPPESALLLVGDADQLPSVQAGRVLESIIESGVFPHAHLREIFRQEGGEENLIVRAAHEVLHGRLPELVTRSPEQSFHFVEARSASVCRDLIARLVQERIPARFHLDPLQDVQVLCPMNKGEVGARALNRRLQEALNPAPQEAIERFGESLSVGDKVIVTANDYDKDVFNGDIGRVIQIERDRSTLRVEFSGRRIDFAFSELDTLSLAFAITVHKAQGSEYDGIVIPLLEESAPLLGRNLLYTAITRGKKLVVIVGTLKALKMAIASAPHLAKRWSGLARRLQRLQRSATRHAGETSAVT